VLIAIGWFTVALSIPDLPISPFKKKAQALE